MPSPDLGAGSLAIRILGRAKTATKSTVLARVKVPGFAFVLDWVRFSLRDGQKPQVSDFPTMSHLLLERQMANITALE